MEAIIAALTVVKEDERIIITDQLIKDFIEINIDELVKEIKEYL